jgi:hypothetical protein
MIDLSSAKLMTSTRLGLTSNGTKSANLLKLLLISFKIEA